MPQRKNKNKKKPSIDRYFQSMPDPSIEIPSPECPTSENPSLEIYLNSKRKQKMSAETFEEYLQVQKSRINEINEEFNETKRLQKIYSGTFATVKIEHIVSTKEFYVIPACDLSKRKEFEENLTAAYKVFDEPFYEIKAKYLCAVRDGWIFCRGEIIEIVISSVEDRPKYNVFLLDYGRTIEVERKDLCILKCPHASIEPYVLKCQLSVLNADENELTMDKTLVNLERISSNALIYFNGFASKKSDTYDIYLLTEEKVDIKSIGKSYSLHESYAAFNRTEIQFDHELCEKWCEKLSKITQTPLDNLRKIQVFLSHVVSPAQIYVQFEAAERLMLKIRHKIDSYVDSNRSNANAMAPAADTKWSIGDKCLVRLQNWYTKCILKMWYRGQIIAVNIEIDDYTVFLLDYGCQTIVKSTELKTISPCLAACPNTVRSCSLAISSDWLAANTEYLHILIAGYKWFAISPHRKEGDNLIVNLWATNDEPNIDIPEIWINIGVTIVSHSVRESIEHFIKMSQYQYKLSKYHENNEPEPIQLDKSFVHHLSSNEFDQIHTDPSNEMQIFESQIVRKWPRPMPIERHTFIGLVTHITKTGIIYLQEESNIEVANDLSVAIGDHLMATERNRSQNCQWKNGDICFAEFESHQYYRAVIKHIYRDQATCLIKYVDYGNKVVKRLDELRTVTMAESIPLLVYRLYVPNLVPNLTNRQWSTVIWTEFASNLQQEMCKVQIININNQINYRKCLPCSIDPICKPYDIYSTLRKQQLAYRTDLDTDFEERLIVG